jgi:hypothetical protein
MCVRRSLIASVLVLLLSSVGFGQSLLQKLEGKLKGALEGAAAAAAPAAEGAASVPGSGYLGLVADEAAEAGTGVRVVSTRAKGPAEAGGLKADDLITAIDGKPIKGLEDLDAILNTAIVGQKLRMTVERAAKLQSLTVTLGTRPTAAPPAEPALTDPSAAPTAEPPAAEPPLTLDPAATTPKPSAPIRSKPATTPLDPLALPADPAATTPRPSLTDPLTEPATTPPAVSGETGGRPSLGITVVPLTDEARASYGLTVRRGALITNVRPGSAADTAGLPIGGVVVALDGKRIDTADDLVGQIRALRVGQEIELTYYEGDKLARKSLRLAPAAAGAFAAPGTTPPGIEPAAASPPSGLDLNLGGSGRPLLNKVEQLVEGFASPRTAPGAIPRGPSTVYDPSEMAALRNQVLQLEETITALEERLKLLEGKLGDTPPAANP